MSKRVASKYKINRRLGVNLWGRPKSPFNKREYGPGEHGQRRRKPTDFGIQLAAKQKLKGYYGNIGEKQFRRYYAEASRRRGDTGENLIGLLERMLTRLPFTVTWPWLTNWRAAKTVGTNLAGQGEEPRAAAGAAGHRIGGARPARLH